ncbi:GumC family protein [Pseudomonadota bacterium]
MTNFNSNKNYYSETLDLNDILLILWKGRRIIITTIIVTVLLALIFVFTKKPVYTAESTIQINPGLQNSLDISSIFSAKSFEHTTIKSEIDIIKSKKVAKKVVEKLNLVEYTTTNTEDLSPEDQLNLKKEYLNKATNIMNNTKVISSPSSYTVKIQYLSTNPEQAALINNTIVEEFLSEKLEIRFESTKKLNDWLNQRVSELGEKLKQSEIAVSQFKEENRIFDSSGRTVEEQKMIALNNQLVLATSEKLKIKARLENTRSLIKSGKIQSSPDIINSQLIQRLKVEETEILRKKADLETKYGLKHPQIINVKAELKDIQKKINLETQNIIRSLQNEIEIAGIKENSIKEKIEVLNEELSNVNKAKVKLGELERDREANKALYASYLTRFKETSQGQENIQTTIQIISKAEVPLNPTHPRKKLILIMSFILGGFLGSGIVFMLKFFHSSVSSIEEIEYITNTPVIGIVPEIKNSHSKIIDYCIKKPESKFTDSLRYILLFLDSLGSEKEKNIKSLLLTSSTLKEGKTSLAICLARIKAKSGKKVLLIDADMRLSSLKYSLKDSIENDLKSYLLGEAKIKDIIYRDEFGEIDYITSKETEVNSQDLLSSHRMKELLEKVYGEYDLVIIDAPPINTISDTFKLLNKVDTSLYVVGLNKTKKSVLTYGFKQINLNRGKISGIVVNYANTGESQHKSIYDIIFRSKIV